MKIFKTKKGFSLVQVMVGLGLAGVISYGVMSQLGQFKSSAVRADRKIEMETFLDNITKTLVRKDVCDANFRGMDVSSANPSVLYANIERTKDLVREGQSYLKKAITIQGIAVSPKNDSSFNLTITAIKNKEKKAYNIAKRTIVISGDMTGTVVNSCYFKMSDVEDIASVCSSSGPGVDVNSSSGEESCYFKGFADKACDNGETLIDVNTSTLSYFSNCSKTFRLTSCPSGRVKTINADGSFVCLVESNLIDTTPVTFTSGNEYKLTVTTDGSNKIQLFATTAIVTPVNGICNNSTTNSCSVGSFSDRTDTSANHLWSCTGSNGGSTASCSKTKALTYSWIEGSWGTCSSGSSSCYFSGNSGTRINAVSSCGDVTVEFACLASHQIGLGLCNWSSSSSSKSRAVYCQSSSGITVGDSNCSGTKPASTSTDGCSGGPIKTPVLVNGSCNNSTTNACTAGTFSDRTDSSTNYLWACTGSNGGSTASCSKAKAAAPTCSKPTCSSGHYAGLCGEGPSYSGDGYYVCGLGTGLHWWCISTTSSAGGLSLANTCLTEATP